MAVMPPTNLQFSSTTSTGTRLSWTKGGGATSTAVFVKQTNIGGATPVGMYAANPQYPLGQEITGTGTGWYCVYFGGGTSVDITGLSPGTTYRASARSYTGSYSTEALLNVTTQQATNRRRAIICGGD